VPGSVGTCQPLPQGSAGEPTCLPYVCDGAGGTCPTQCTSDAQCTGTAKCNNGTCELTVNGRVNLACGCGSASASEASAFFALILLGLFALRRSEARP
jgi:MYXO-CTERM domain-containing protein